VIAAIQRLCVRLPRATRILTVLPDRGERYLDTVYDDQWLSRMKDRHLARTANNPTNLSMEQTA
jgi:cysteine synthase A